MGYQDLHFRINYTLCIIHINYEPVYSRAVRYDDIYRIEEIKNLSYHIMFYRLYRGVAKYIVYGNTFSSFE